MKKLIAVLSTMVWSLFFVNAIQAQCSSSGKSNTSKTTIGNTTINPEKDIVSNIINSKKLSTLVAAVKAANLVSTLQSDGPFTVFAPTNEAFDRIPAVFKKALAKNPAALTDILLYHVAADKLTATDVLSGNAITTLQGSSIQPFLWREAPFINDSKIIATDLMAGNGVVHVIDKVMIPRSIKSDIYRSMIRDYLNSRR